MAHVLEETLRRVQLDPSVSRQAALLHQRRLLNRVDFLNDSSSSILAANSHLLGECEVREKQTSRFQFIFERLDVKIYT